MTLIPIATFVAALGLVVCFEAIYAFLDRRWSLPVDKEMWALLYWCAVVLLGVTSHVIPWPPDHGFRWAPFGLVCLCHFLVTFEDPGWSPLGPRMQPPIVEAPSQSQNADVAGQPNSAASSAGTDKRHLQVPRDEYKG